MFIEQGRIKEEESRKHMKRLLNRLASRESEPLSRSQIIFWWERRRMVFNLILIICIAISFLLFFIIDNGSLDRVNFFGLIGGLFLANFFYTGGWTSELIASSFLQNTKSWAIRSFKIGIILSVCITLLPGIVCAIEVAINNERFSNPFGHFAKHMPSYNELVGTYKIDLNKADQISNDDIAQEPSITLNSDKTFSISNFPIFAGMGYELCDGHGHWRPDNQRYSGNPSEIRLTLDSLYNSKTMDRHDKSEVYLYIYNNKPPYKMYQLIGDPDIWAGIIYERK